LAGKAAGELRVIAAVAGRPAGLRNDGVHALAYNFADFWEAVARHRGEAPALIHEDRTISWRAFEGRAARLATVMADAGLAHGAKVGVYLQNGPEYLEAMFAAFKLRAVPININWRYQEAELAYPR
jgi:fatty-acyl-CoA synthase